MSEILIFVTGFIVGATVMAGLVALFGLEAQEDD